MDNKFDRRAVYVDGVRFKKLPIPPTSQSLHVVKRILEGRERLQENAYVDDDGVLRWKSKDNPVPVSVLERDLFLEVSDVQKRADDEDLERTLAEYREAEANREYTDEDLFEMRAAFGEGTSVVNVITGERIQL